MGDLKNDPGHSMFKIMEEKQLNTGVNLKINVLI